MGTVKSQALVKWFDRKFEPDVSNDHYEDILTRLAYFPAILNQSLDNYPESIATVKTGGKWSIHENIGHLILLEKLWRSRFQDIKGGNQNLSSADLNNSATDQASFNKYPLNKLTKSLAHERRQTIALLQNMDEEDFLKTSIHPRLNRPMSIVELMHFVSEHDTHHMQSILFIIANTENN
jgi:uncharacterized damage-inducible protein DinB